MIAAIAMPSSPSRGDDRGDALEQPQRVVGGEAAEDRDDQHREAEAEQRRGRDPSPGGPVGDHHFIVRAITSALDLVRALVDLRDLGVAHVALDGVLADVAVAAEHLDRLDRDGHRGVGGEQLGHRGVLAAVGLVAVDLRARLVEQLAGGGRARLHVGELELDPLELVDRLAELACARARRRRRSRWRPARCRRPGRRRRGASASSVPSATERPLPSAPTRFACGMRTSSKIGWPVGEPLMPSLCSSLPTLKPGRSASTTNADRRRLSRSVTAKTT